MDSNEKKNKLMQMMPFAVLIVAVGFAFGIYYVLFTPKLARVMQGGELDNRPFVSMLNDQDRYLSELQSAIGDYSILNEQHKRRVGLVIPDNEDVPGLFVQLDELARANGMILLSIDTINNNLENGPNGAKLVRVSINVAGGNYEQLKLLLNDFERLVRIADIESITFGSGEGTVRTYSITLNVYYMEKEAGIEKAIDDTPVMPNYIAD